MYNDMYHNILSLLQQNLTCIKTLLAALTNACLALCLFGHKLLE